MKTVAFETFWAQMRMDALRDPLAHSDQSVRTYLNVNPEGALLRETQDIVEELHMMSGLFSQQYQVVKDFKKSLEKLNEKREHKTHTPNESVLRDSVGGLGLQMSMSHATLLNESPAVPKSTLLRAEETLNQIKERKEEISRLEEAAKRINSQVEFSDQHFFDVCATDISITAPRSPHSKTAAG